jgi:hypothetical protein
MERKSERIAPSGFKRGSMLRSGEAATAYHVIVTTGWNGRMNK